MAESELDKAMIVNWALAELGLAPEFSIDDETTLGGQVDIFWPRAVVHAFGLHDWTFCRRTTQLPRQAEAPATGYLYGYDLPGDRLGEPLKLLSDPRRKTPIRDFRIEGDQLSCDEPQAYAVCKVERDPRNWDPVFATCFATLLASYLAVPLQHDLEMAEAKRVEATGSRSEGGTGGSFGRLIAQNRAAHPPGSPLYQDDPLTAGRASNWAGKW